MIKKRDGRLIKKAIGLFLPAVGALFFACIYPSCMLPVMADNNTTTTTTKEQLDEAAEKKKEKEQELEGAKKDLEITRANLRGLEGQKNTYQGQMELLNCNLQLVADNLAVLENSMAIKQIEIDETMAILEETRQSRLEQYESMKARIRYFYETGQDDYLELLLSADSFGEMLNYAEYLEELSAYDRAMIEQYAETESLIAAKEAELEEEMQELEEMKAETEAEQELVTGMINETAANIAITADNINMTQAAANAYETQVDQKAAEAAKAAADYAAIKAKYEEELRLSKLAAASAWRDISEVTFEEGDRYLLANLIYCEAGGEPYEGQVAVGAVVINRVLSSRYPQTVTGVIYQRSQFAPVGDGHLASALANNKATASCYQAADVAMGGTTNVGNCLYFRTPIPGLTGLQIGGHIFY